jgi:hypothetical protein
MITKLKTVLSILGDKKEVFILVVKWRLAEAAAVPVAVGSIVPFAFSGYQLTSGKSYHSDYCSGNYRTTEAQSHIDFTNNSYIHKL